MVVVTLVGQLSRSALGAILALLCPVARTAWNEIGFARAPELDPRPRRRHRFGIAFKAPHESDRDASSSVPLRSTRRTTTCRQPAALPGAVYLLIAGGGFGEEVVFRDFCSSDSASCSVRAKPQAGIVLLTAGCLRCSTTLTKGSPASSRARSPARVRDHLRGHGTDLDPDVRCMPRST